MLWFSNYFINILIWILLCVFVGIESQEQNNYGPYKIEYLSYEICKGPKRGECGTVRIESTQNMSNVPFILDFPNDCPIKNARVVIGKMENNNRFKKMWNYQINNPCDHFVLGPLLRKLFNLGKACKIVKGHYEVHINMNDLATKFLGSNFFYDTYYFKTLSFNSINNFFCVYSEIKVLKL